MAFRKLVAKFGAVAAAATVAALVSLAAPASAQTPLGSGSVTPTTVQTQAVYSAAGTHPYAGDAGVITINIPSGETVLTPGTPLKWEECNANPTKQSNCDGLTIQQYDPGTSTTITPNADGSATIEMNLYILPTGNDGTAPDVDDVSNTNPNGFDPNSTVTCDDGSDPNPSPGQFNPSTPADPCAIWVGDSTANWSSGFVFSGLTPVPNTTPLVPPTTTSTTAATTSTTAATTSTTAATTSTTAATTSTTGATTSTTGATTSTTGATTTTTSPPPATPESPYVPLLPVGAVVVAGGGFFFYRLRHRRANN